MVEVTPMGNCLTPMDIEKLLADTLPTEEKARAQAHLRACERCRVQLEARRADQELFGQIKRAYRQENGSEPHESDPTRSGVGGAASPGRNLDTIEGYDILSEIHRGGQGVVYKAVQKATKRTVALKVLLEGPYASPRQRHRFEREIDLVASLQHAHIVTVYDSGVTRDGRHYFAMEYIHGQPLNAYLSDKNLSIDGTLRLFQQICAAVNYAHQHGVIHRDLKPSNIRVDADGQPHILDFGLAKAAGTDLTAGAPVTVTGEFMGTLAYASPEQTKGDPRLIDIRTDVYSLGVILYEMLTGKYPYAVVGQMAEVLKNIAEAEPRKPSTIRRQIKDEVETIVLKALAKEKERRYQSAENLARDIEHYLNGEPIDAKRDSGWYLIRKSLRRYRVPVAVAAAFVILLGASTVAFFDHVPEPESRASASRGGSGGGGPGQADSDRAAGARRGERSTGCRRGDEGRATGRGSQVDSRLPPEVAGGIGAIPRERRGRADRPRGAGSGDAEDQLATRKSPRDPRRPADARW
jgi:serine/threonine protein kinase